MKLGEAFIEVRPDTKQFKQELEQQTTGAAQSVSRGLGRVLAGGAFIAGAKQAIDAASDLNESVNVTNITFGKAEDKVASFAKTAAESIGQSERAARSAAATFGGLLLNLGYTEDAAADTSIQLTKLASDLGSAFNTDPAEAALALSSALRGEQEPIQRYNVLLSDQAVRQEAVRLGLAATTATVDESGKVQARLSLIMEQTSRVQGDFANTSEGAANAQRIAAAKAEDSAADLGQNVLPIYERAVAVVGDIADIFGALPEPVQTGIIAIAGIAVVAGPLHTAGQALSSMVATARKAPEAFDRAAVGTYNLAGGTTRMGRALALVGWGAGIAGAVAYARSLNDVSANVEHLQAGFKSATDAEVERLGRQLVAFSDSLAGGDLTELITQVADSNTLLAERMIDAAEAAGLDADKIDDLRAITDTKRESDVQGAKDQEKYGDEIDKAAGKTEGLTEATKEQVDALNDLLEATLAQFDANLGYRRAVDNTQEAEEELASLRRHGKVDTEEYRDALLEAEGALLAQADAAVKLYEDTAAANGQTLDGKQKTEIYKNELIKLAETLAPGSQLRKQLEAYIFTLGAIPGEIHTSITLDIPTRNPDARRGVYGFDPTPATGFAAGGDVMDGLFRVHDGEVLSKQGSSVSVISGAPTALSGATYYTTIAVYGTTGESPAEALTRSARRIGEEVTSRA